MTEKKSKKLSNTKEEWNKAITSKDPTVANTLDLEKLAKEAMKKFKSLQ